MRINKRLIAFMLAIAIVASVFTLSLISVFAKSTGLILNVMTTSVIDGTDDLVWFTYTPEVDGTYSLLSYNTPASECYLFVKEVNKETKQKEYKQLAYSCDDPNFEENEHNNRQFCLTYELDAGTTYYYAVGWYLSESRTSGNTKVMLRCDRFDVDVERVEVYFDGTLDKSQDATLIKDVNGEPYYSYDISKIVQNCAVTVYFADGRAITTFNGYVDGLKVSFTHNQEINHWYPNFDEEYTENKLKITVVDKSCYLNINIIDSSKNLIDVRFTDTLGEPIKSGTIYYNDIPRAEIKSGIAQVYIDDKLYHCEIKGDNILSKKVYINSKMKNFQLCAYDYVNDGVINAKDFVFIKDKDERVKQDFKRFINFTSEDYYF